MQEYIYIYIYIYLSLCVCIIAEVGIPILRSKLTTCSDTEMILELHEVVDTAWT